MVKNKIKITHTKTQLANITSYKLTLVPLTLSYSKERIFTNKHCPEMVKNLPACYCTDWSL